jgi:hypothetical protein
MALAMILLDLVSTLLVGSCEDRLSLSLSQCPTTKDFAASKPTAVDARPAHVPSW